MIIRVGQIWEKRYDGLQYEVIRIEGNFVLVKVYGEKGVYETFYSKEYLTKFLKLREEAMEKQEEKNTEVVVPEYVANYLDNLEAQSIGYVFDTAMNYTWSSIDTFSEEEEKALKWIASNQNEMAHAWVFGWQGKKMNTWLVRLINEYGKEVYFESWANRGDDVLKYWTTPEKEDARLFSEKDNALKLAVAIGGEVVINKEEEN